MAKPTLTSTIPSESDIAQIESCNGHQRIAAIDYLQKRFGEHRERLARCAPKIAEKIDSQLRKMSEINDTINDVLQDGIAAINRCIDVLRDRAGALREQERLVAELKAAEEALEDPHALRLRDEDFIRLQLTVKRTPPRIAELQKKIDLLTSEARKMLVESGVDLPALVEQVTREGDPDNLVRAKLFTRGL